VQLVDTTDFWILIATAAAFGAIGGLIYELLLPVRRRTGMIELPNIVRSGAKPRWVDLGFIASVIVGAVAAVAILFIFPPEISVTVDVDGVSTTTKSYDLIKLVGLSLITGSAGGSFIAAMQARVLVQVKDAEAASTKAQLEKISEQAVAGDTQPSLVKSLDTLIAGLPSTPD